MSAIDVKQGLDVHHPSVELGLSVSLNSIPFSLAGKAMNAAATSNLLNPLNKGQGKFSRYVGKPFRALARLIYVIIFPVIAGLFGTVYHFGGAAICAVKYKCTKDQQKKQELFVKSSAHLFAFIQDIKAWGQCGNPLSFSFNAMMFSCSNGTRAQLTSKFFPAYPAQGGSPLHGETISEMVYMRIATRDFR